MKLIPTFEGSSKGMDGLRRSEKANRKIEKLVGTTTEKGGIKLKFGKCKIYELSSFIDVTVTYKEKTFEGEHEWDFYQEGWGFGFKDKDQFKKELPDEDIDTIEDNITDIVYTKVKMN